MKKVLTSGDTQFESLNNAHICRTQTNLYFNSSNKKDPHKKQGSKTPSEWLSSLNLAI